MKVSLQLAQQFSKVELRSLAPEELVQRMGAQLGAIEEVEDYAPLYEGVVVVRVISCEQHPNADKLHVCLVDDGGVAENVERTAEGYVQVVCGAPNVTAGMFAAWIPPTVAVPSTRNDAELFVLEARELRGKVSNGMLASEKELAISDNHDGILEITAEEIGHEPQAGEQLVDLFGLNDFVVTCENKMFTHRPDCFGNMGVAREIAGIFGMRYESPEWYLQAPVFASADKVQLEVKNTIPELVARLSVVAMDGVAVEQSPVWLRALLKRVGIKAVNTVVDVTNYIMHLTGQPLHAFDYDKLVGLSSQPSLQARHAKKGEKLALLNGKTITLTEEDMVIATDKTVVALAGIMGGADTEVDETTKRIVIECANFDMYAVRRSSMRHGLFTDAVTRFNKGQSPLQNDRVLAYAMRLMNEYTGAVQASQAYDLTTFDTAGDVLNHVETTVDFVNARLGSDLTAEDMKTMLENVECAVETDGKKLLITAPFWRMDIAIAEDVVEEIGRLYGYDRLAIALPKRPAKPAPKNPLREYKQSVRNMMRAGGANEVLTYSFVHGDMLQSAGIDAEKWCYHVRNALSPDLQYYRPSVLPSLLGRVHANIKAQAGSDTNAFILFELGKAHKKDYLEEETKLPQEFQRLAGVYVADAKSIARDAGSPYYLVKRYVDQLTNGTAEYLPLDSNDYPVAAPFQKGRSAVVSIDGEVLGVIGEFRPQVQKAFKLPHASAGFELDTVLLHTMVQPPHYAPLSNFPSSSQDITLEVDEGVQWGAVQQLLKAELAVLGAELGYHVQLDAVSVYQDAVTKCRRFTFRVTVTHTDKTLTTSEVSSVLDAIAKGAHEKMAARRI